MSAAAPNRTQVLAKLKEGEKLAERRVELAKDALEKSLDKMRNAAYNLAAEKQILGDRQGKLNALQPELPGHLYMVDGGKRSTVRSRNKRSKSKGRRRA